MAYYSLVNTPPKPRKLIAGTILKLEGFPLQRYIQDFNQEELRQSKELWRAYASRKDLIDFAAQDPNANRRKRVYGYDPATLTYYVQTPEHQRRINPASIKLDINRFVAGVQGEARTLAAQMVTGTITPQQWYDESMRRAKLSYRAVVDVARGSDEQMSNEQNNHWLEIALLLLLLLNNLSDDILDARIPADGRLLAAAGRIQSAGNGIFENWKLWDATLKGYIESIRILGPNENHCHDDLHTPGCIELAALGWVSIHKQIPIGQATCRQYCKCRLEFRKDFTPIALSMF